MDAPLHLHGHRQGFPNGVAAGSTTEGIRDASGSGVRDKRRSTTNISKRKNKKKKQTSFSDSASSASSSNNRCTIPSSQKGIKISRKQSRIRVGSLAAARRSVGPSDVDALGLPLGMSIAAVVAQVLEKRSVTGEKLSADYLSEICALALKESLGNVFGDQFCNLVTNFEISFKSTLTTLRLISDSSQDVGDQRQRPGLRGSSCSVTRTVIPLDKVENASGLYGSPQGSESPPHRNCSEQQQNTGYRESSFEAANSPLSLPRLEDFACSPGDAYGFRSFDSRTRNDRETHEQIKEKMNMNLMNQQLVVHDRQMEQQLASTSGSTVLSTMERSVFEQTRSNDLKTFEIGLIMKQLQLKEKYLALKSDSNLLGRLTLSMGFSKASFRAEKFKIQLQDSRHVDLLRRCLDFLVAGLIIMLVSLAYGTYIYSHRRIIEATEACSPYSESKSTSWWMPKSVTTFNSGLQLLRCQIQVFSRMLFGALMIGAIAVLLIQRSAASHQTMPVTFMLLLLGIACGYAGKLCIDTLGGAGNCWLLYWEALCLLHFFSNVFHSTLFVILNGPITVAERVEYNPKFPYWVRRMLYFTVLLVLPLLCGFMPFASLQEWFSHFCLQAVDFMTPDDD